MNQLQTQIVDPHVRQLLFSVFGPDLIQRHPSPIRLTDEYQEFFITLDKAPQNLHAFLRQYEGVLLGGLFEALWLYFLNHAPGWQVLARNVQIRDENRTLGELDILAEHVTTGCHHFELAVKFYLLAPEKNGHDLTHWVGPNARDNLNLKLNRLQHHQLSMLYREETQAALKQLHIPTIKQQSIILKGNLLLPAKPFTVLNLSNEINSPQGYWLHASQLASVFTFEANWTILTKPQWLCPFLSKQPSAEVTIYNTLELINAITEENTREKFKPLLIVRLNPAQGMWQEHQRYMIVADDWPADFKN